MINVAQLVQSFTGAVSKADAEPVSVWEIGNFFVVDGEYAILLELDYDCEVIILGFENGRTESGGYGYWKWRGIQFVGVA